MPPRSRVFPSVVSDDRILELFTSSSVRLKASTVRESLEVNRSRIRNIEASLRRLAGSRALRSLPSQSARYSKPYYALPLQGEQEEKGPLPAGDVAVDLAASDPEENSGQSPEPGAAPPSSSAAGASSSSSLLLAAVAALRAVQHPDAIDALRVLQIPARHTAHMGRRRSV
jgi:hypothetical protein